MKTLQGNFNIEVTGVCDETAISDFAQSGVWLECVCALWAGFLNIFGNLVSFDAKCCLKHVSDNFT